MGRLPRDGDASGLRRMLELPVAAVRGDVHPSVASQKLQDLRNLHPFSPRLENGRRNRRLTDTAPISDGNQREAALDVRRSFIVQAPAGSGKTDLLVKRYAKLLGVVE